MAKNAKVAEQEEVEITPELEAARLRIVELEKQIAAEREAKSSLKIHASEAREVADSLLVALQHFRENSTIKAFETVKDAQSRLRELSARK